MLLATAASEAEAPGLRGSLLPSAPQPRALSPLEGKATVLRVDAGADGPRAAGSLCADRAVGGRGVAWAWAAAPRGPGARLPSPALLRGCYPPGCPVVALRLSLRRHRANKHSPVGTAASWSRPETSQCVILVTYITSLPRSSRVSSGHFIPAVPPPPLPSPPAPFLLFLLFTRRIK